MHYVMYIKDHKSLPTFTKIFCANEYRYILNYGDMDLSDGRTKRFVNMNKGRGKKRPIFVVFDYKGGPS